jgi:hypothetical protein
MSDPDRARHQTRTVLGVAALIALPVLCCAGPALLGAAALTTGLGVLGGALHNPWLLGTAAVLACVALGWWRSRRASSTHGSVCRPPESESGTFRGRRAFSLLAGVSHYL